MPGIYAFIHQLLPAGAVSVEVNYGNGRAIITARDQERARAKESEGTRNQFCGAKCFCFSSASHGNQSII